MDKELVFLKEENPITTTRIIAEEFGKEHRNVIQALENLECSQGFRRLNFQQSKYLNKQGKLMPEFEVTEAGFMFLVMGFTGKKAAKIKEQFIGAFLAMRDLLRRQIESTEQWYIIRREGKEVRKSTTDIIKDFIEYAKVQGSSHSDKYYVNLTKMENKALFIVEQKFPNIRDVLSVMQLTYIRVADHLVCQAILKGMEDELPYKEIYKLAKERVEQFAASIKKTPVLEETKGKYFID